MAGGGEGDDVLDDADAAVGRGAASENVEKRGRRWRDVPIGKRKRRVSLARLVGEFDEVLCRVSNAVCFSHSSALHLERR